MGYIILNNTLPVYRDDNDLIYLSGNGTPFYEMLIVGGGGGGASSGSGGSGGGAQLYYITGSTLITGDYNLTISSGGNAGSNGGTTTFYSNTATGGGAGGSNSNGGNGANGGGAGFGSFGSNRNGGNGNGCCSDFWISGWDGPGWGGLDGGDSETFDIDPPGSYSYAGFGGGCREPGGNTGGAPAGKSFNISGTLLGYAGGGGAARVVAGVWSVANGRDGGGGSNGDAVRGGGGSGGGGSAAKGGDGIVIIKYNKLFNNCYGGDEIYEDLYRTHIYNIPGNNTFSVR